MLVEVKHNFGSKKKQWILLLGTIAVIAVPTAVCAPPTSTSSQDVYGELDPREFGGDVEGKSELGMYQKAAASVDGGPCAEIATDVYKRNGTVVDAAVAALFCNGVVHSHSMGIGGGFIMTLYIREEGQTYSLMARETAPAAADRDMYKGDAGLSKKGPLSIAIPGEINGYYAAKERFGNPSVSWASLIQPTIDMCENGIRITRSNAQAIKSKKEDIKKDEGLKSTFINPETDDVWNEGDIIRRPKLAETLRRIAKNGAKEFYEGETAKKLAEDLSKAGGIITEEDLKNYEARWEDPVSFNLSGKYEAFSSPPPGGGIILSAILKVIDQYELDQEDLIVPSTYQRFVEACKYAYAERTLLGDWREDPAIADSVKNVLNSLTTDEWARGIRLNISDTSTVNDAEHYGADYANTDDGGTAHLSFLAPNGDAVAVTSTINSYFGSLYMSPSTGVILNNEMDDFSSPGFANVYGIAPSAANFIKPGKRPTSSMSPTIIVGKDDGNVRMIIGASGGPKIISGVALAIIRHLWLGQNIKEAIDSYRLHHQLLPMILQYEKGFPQSIIDDLESYGHVVKETSAGSVLQGIAVYPNGTISANNDWRKAGGISGF